VSGSRNQSQLAISAQQYFPTYQIPDESEIVLKEYDLSAQSLAADQRGISVAAGVLVIIAGSITTIVGSDNGEAYLGKMVGSATAQTEILTYLAIFGLACLAIRYLSELQKSATHGARKIVILRRLLGLDYGNMEKVLPATGVEGANEPFAIPLFPGWGATVSLAALTVSAVSAYMFYGLALSFDASSKSLLHNFLQISGALRPWASVGIAVGVLGALLALYRRFLFEEWETYRYFAASLFGVVVRIPLKDRMGYVLYRLELSVYEAKRLGIDLKKFEKILLRIEDRRFYKHSGNSVRALAGAVYRRVRYKAVGGGSTIAQQLCRSNFISTIPRDIRRKLIEWMLAPWIFVRYKRGDVLELYLCSVRFAYGVEGVPAALRFYFNAPLSATTPWNPSTAQIFFLIERLSNVSRSIPVKRVRALVHDALNEGLLNQSDVIELQALYGDQVANGNLIDPGRPIRF